MQSLTMMSQSSVSLQICLYLNRNTIRISAPVQEGISLTSFLTGQAYAFFFIKGMRSGVIKKLDPKGLRDL
jgi:hypothetical protein